MIIKSMSRKEASFGQLMNYIDRDGAQERTRIRYNLLGRDRERIRAEFERNGEHMAKRKNGVFMYHEIISITRARGIDVETQKQRLYEIAQEYVAARAPNNLCYGGLHDDKDHSLHYHLMISANGVGEAKRHRLSKEQFRSIQVELERYVLATYPELEQKKAIEKTAETRILKAEAELKRRGGKATEREEIGARIDEALEHSNDKQEFLRELKAQGFDLYVRGQNIGVIDRETGKRHRVKTLDASLPERLQERLLQEGLSAKADQKAKSKERPEENRRRANEKEKEQSGRGKEDRKDENMSNGQDEPIREPSPERQEKIDKGHIKPDPARDKMSHDDWRAQDSFATKVQQSVRRTRDDFEGRTEKLENQEKEAPEQQRWREEMQQKRDSERSQDRTQDRGDQGRDDDDFER